MKRHWKSLLWAGLCLILLAGFAALSLGDRRTVSAMTPQLAAERWETGEKPYAMASVFLTADQAIDAQRMGEIYLKVENALTAGGVPSEAYPWFYAASCQRDGVLENGKARSNVELTAVDGDFFRIHPMTPVSGWYPDPQEVMRDRIVLNRQAAWELFYSDNVAGQFLTLEGMTFQVAAVVDTEQDRFHLLSAGDRPRAWIFWDALPQQQIRYTCMEMVLPQPVKDFAASTLRTACGIPETVPVTDNSARFGLIHRWQVLRQLSTRGITEQPIAYPYWENAARLAENRLAIRLIPEAILLAIPILSLLILLWYLNRRRTWGLRSIRKLAENAIDKKHQRDWEKYNRHA